MLCVKCKKDIPDGAPFCCWCGKKQAAEQKKDPPQKQANAYLLAALRLLFGCKKVYKKAALLLCRYTNLLQTQKTFAKTLDFVASLCYNIYRNKEHRAAKRSGHYDKDNDNNELAEV